MVACAIAGKLATQLWLERLNRCHVMAHADRVPEAFRGFVPEAAYEKSVRYTLAQGALHRVELVWGAVVLLAVLFSGILPGAFKVWVQALGESSWALAGFLFVVSVALSLPGLPLDWYAQFRLEDRFGFNTTTQKLWWLDRLKGVLLGALLGYPLLLLVLKLFAWTGGWWWLWAWGALLAFQLVMTVLAPVVILPWFNKFTPLPAGSLRQRLEALAARADFRARNIQVMDGSKRSRHSNAFFTGFGRFRKIVLFDTLVEQLTEAEVEAVLAHEIGHYKKQHIPRMIAASALGSLAGFYLLAVLAGKEWFAGGFGFEPGRIAPVLLLFGLLSGVVTFWFSPVIHWWMRKFEYQADAFAAANSEEPGSLIGALRKLNEKNLSNLRPHPLYSGFYYSHPTLLERERALAKVALPRAGAAPGLVGG
jgi:STE24 endopeptidase